MKVMKETIKAISEVVIVEAIFLVIAWYLQAIQPLGYGWYSKFIMILFGIIGILAHRKVYEYGLIPRNLKFNLIWSAYIILIFVLTSLVTLIISTLSGTLRMICLHTLMIDLIWFFIFVGFAEELFFRGYIQSRLNEVFRKKYRRILWVRFEWSEGTLITGVFFFGLAHIFVAINPFTSRIIFSPVIVMVVISACFMGVIFGVLREKTGDVLLPTILHGLIDFTTFSLGRLIGLMFSSIATGVALFLFFLLIFERMLREEITP